MSRRENEISRLGARAGADTDVLALAARNEAAESMVLQLNTTVRGDQAACTLHGVHCMVYCMVYGIEAGMELHDHSM